MVKFVTKILCVCCVWETLSELIRMSKSLSTFLQILWSAKSLSSFSQFLKKTLDFLKREGNAIASIALIPDLYFLKKKLVLGESLFCL